MDKIEFDKIVALMATAREPRSISGWVLRTDMRSILRQFLETEMQGTVPATNFLATVEANINNDNLSDGDFREFIRNTMSIVQYKAKETN